MKASLKNAEICLASENNEEAEFLRSHRTGTIYFVGNDSQYRDEVSIYLSHFRCSHSELCEIGKDLKQDMDILNESLNRFLNIR
jgi:hypothetical protein